MVRNLSAQIPLAGQTVNDNPSLLRQLLLGKGLNARCRRLTVPLDITLEIIWSAKVMIVLVQAIRHAAESA